MENQYLVELAQKYGTPLYVYDADKIASQIKRLNDAFTGVNLKLKYATKALSNISVLKWIKKHGAGLDVVSIQEAYLGLKAGFDPKDILYTPNCVSIDEIIEAVDLGLTINIDNISILEQFGHRYKNTVPCCVRLNPHIMAGGNTKISTGHIDSKFGISILQMRHLLRVIETYNIHVIGLHIHTGSDILNPEAFLRGTEIIFEVAEDFSDLEFIDFGSGFKVAYKEEDVTTDIEMLGKELSKSFKNFCKARGKELELWFEPGKFIVSEAGYFLSKVNVIKTTPATVFVGLDTGMNHLLRPMMYDAYHTIENISNPSATQRVYTVVGYICETDTFGTDRKLSEVRERDIIAIKNAGAYGFSMASNYNSRYRPAEVLVHDGTDQLVRKRESLDDLLRNQIIVDFE
ncbi:diaminopimelate decarboxylase [Marivirga sp. S37H4]|uniref:Diaminopimelate decarboxylase n=1 Tax=Marivirga aurantiaca TaxID=2802615 RepID=A0A935C9Q1_9BACT|nr:diaminopimelate decarboxylase [Marivirga aurantiaca]MBK6265737.1 diaminopimelate decarboxylase [Marivirga aurantiaca]